MYKTAPTSLAGGRGRARFLPGERASRLRGARLGRSLQLRHGRGHAVSALVEHAGDAIQLALDVVVESGSHPGVADPPRLDVPVVDRPDDHVQEVGREQRLLPLEDPGHPLDGRLDRVGVLVDERDGAAHLFVARDGVQSTGAVDVPLRPQAVARLAHPLQEAQEVGELVLRLRIRQHKLRPSVLGRQF